MIRVYGAKEVTEAMANVPEATEATKDTMEAVEEVIAITAYPASLRQTRGASSCFNSLFLLYRWVQQTQETT